MVYLDVDEFEIDFDKLKIFTLEELQIYSYKNIAYRNDIWLQLVMTRIMTVTVLMTLKADFEVSEVRTAELKERHQDVTNAFAIYKKTLT